MKAVDLIITYVSGRQEKRWYKTEKEAQKDRDKFESFSTVILTEILPVRRVPRE